MPEMDAWTYLVAVVCGGVVGVDAVSWPQAMVSRPIVAATLGGAFLGDPASGLLVGAVLELLSLRHPPFGAARYPDTGPAGLVAGAAFAASGGGVAALAVAVSIGWMLGWVGARTVYLLRRLNGRLVGDQASLAAAPGRLERRQRLAVGLDFARGGALTAAFLVPAALVARVVPAAGGAVGPVVAATVAVVVGGAAGTAAGGLYGGRRGWLLLAAGGLASVVALVLA
jgi:mannose/fructose/N-acetylgalactosamine-specific phosphotransferase system component IIC